MHSQTQEDTRPYMSEGEQIAHLERLSDAQLRHPGPILADLQQRYRINEYSLKSRCEKVLNGRQAMREAVNIAEQLQLITGDCWQASYEQRHSREYILLTAEPYQISLNFSSAWAGQDRIMIRGKFSTDANGHNRLKRAEEDQSITVSRKRTPNAIARDINRRLLPDYKAAEDRNRQLIQHANARISRFEAAAALLAQVMDRDGLNAVNRFKSRDKGDPVAFETYKNGDRQRIRAELNGSMRMTVKIEGLSLETGLDLLQMLQTIKKAEELAEAERMRCPHCGGHHGECYDTYCSNPRHCDGSDKKPLEYCPSCTRAGKVWPR